MSADESHVFSLLREKTGLSIKDVAEKTGRTLRTIYRWENGDSQPDKMATNMLQKIAEKVNTTYSSKVPKFSFIDLFAGIGGMRLGFEAVGGKCIFTSEWNKYSRQTYQANFPIDHPMEGDITKIPAKEIPNHDVLLAGFPCQPFSIAGVSKKNSLGIPHGFLNETQGTLFFEIERILQYHQPAAFVLENVKNLINHDKGNTFRVIEDTLKRKLGYQVHWRIINAKSFVPQNRERIFIVGFREKNNFDFNRIKIPDEKEGPKLSSILHPEDGSELEEFPYTIGDTAKVSEKYTLTEHLWNYLQEYSKKHKELGHGFGYGLVGPEDVARTLSARYHKDGSEILIKQSEKRPRRLTPRECSRLMGYDKFNESIFEIPVSDTQAYRQFGNGVAVPVVKMVANAILPYLVSDTFNITNEISQLSLLE